MDTRFTVAAQVLGYLAWRSEHGEEWVSSDELGRCINTHSVVVRRLLSQLLKARLIETRRGATGGSRLARPANAIHLGEVFDAVTEPGSSLISFPREAERDECDIGEHIEAILREVISEAESVFRRNLARTTVAEFSRKVVERITSLGLCCPEEHLPAPVAPPVDQRAVKPIAKSVAKPSAAQPPRGKVKPPRH
jgi:Rrf2 family protein